MKNVVLHIGRTMRRPIFLLCIVGSLLAVGVLAGYNAKTATFIKKIAVFGLQSCPVWDIYFSADTLNAGPLPGDISLMIDHRLHLRLLGVQQSGQLSVFRLGNLVGCVENVQLGLHAGGLAALNHAFQSTIQHCPSPPFQVVSASPSVSSMPSSRRVMRYS